MDTEEDQEEKKTLYLGNALEHHKKKLRAQQNNSRQTVKEQNKTNPFEQRAQSAVDFYYNDLS